MLNNSNFDLSIFLFIFSLKDERTSEERENARASSYLNLTLSILEAALALFQRSNLAKASLRSKL